MIIMSTEENKKRFGELLYENTFNILKNETQSSIIATRICTQRYKTEEDKHECLQGVVISYHKLHKKQI
jgi:hypothetical protein